MTAPPMTRADIERHVRDTLCELFELAPEAVIPAAQLRRDLGLDSIDAVDLAVKFQELIGKKLPLSDLMSIQTVSDVVDVVERHVGEG